jgi:hypothetical protein
MPKASRELLSLIGEHDTGAGITFETRPRSRWAYADRVFNTRTFYPLESEGLIDVGNGHTDPVRITDAGRRHLRAAADA